MGPVLDENHKYDAAFWHGVLSKAKHIDGSKLLLALARQKIEGWCALYGGLTPSELHALLEDLKSVMEQGRERQGVIRKPPARPAPAKPSKTSPRPYLRVIK
jgi:hypothetical protein